MNNSQLNFQGISIIIDRNKFQQVIYQLSFFDRHTIKTLITMNLPQLNKQMRSAKSVPDSSDVNLRNYHKLVKMKKLLMDAEMKVINRVKLFQKASQKVLKKKEHQMKVNEKLQLIKKDTFYSRLRPKTRQSRNNLHLSQNCIKNIRSTENTFIKTNNYIQQPQPKAPWTPPKLLAERINQQRLHNAKLIKQDRQRNKIIIEQRKQKQIERKLQSANLIRRQRQKVKLVKQQCIKQRQEDHKKIIQQKYQKERKEFLQIQRHLQQLQQQQKQALITWKKTVQN